MDNGKDKCLKDKCLKDKCLKDKCLKDKCLKDKCLKDECIKDKYLNNKEHTLRVSLTAKKNYITKKITVYGIVQGVGFRPFVYRLAKKHGIFGTVRNLGGLVEIIAQSSKHNFHNFMEELLDNPEAEYEIISSEVQDLEPNNFSEFKIMDSGNNNEVAIIPPDLPVCSKCKEELYQEQDRRFLNPFISCMACGPRYTIIENLPYDRQNTTMRDYEMCPSCNHEYTSAQSRRFHAQTISCNDCGPYLIFREMNVSISENRCITNQVKNSTKKCYEHLEEINDLKVHSNQQDLLDTEVFQRELHDTKVFQQELINAEAYGKAVGILKSGGIIAVKGIGGYHFVCSPFMEESVLNLRKLKGREEKPFAVMFESIPSIQEYCFISIEERKLLESKARPIVLLLTTERNMAPSTNKASMYCGAFLPYTPLQIMLTRECGPLIMTSANISNRPIIKDDKEMLSIQSPFLKGILYNTRRIVRSVDDSVAKIIDKKPQLIRRSRGYVPYPIFLKTKENNKENNKENSEENSKENSEENSKENSEENNNKNSRLNSNENCKQIFAAGSDLKAAFCLYKNGNAVVSQYFGDLEEQTIFKEYENSVADLSSLLKITPDIAVCDYHPNYHSTKFAKSLGLPVHYVQHHHAHIASVMAEHDLNEKVIGIAFDGTGYGADGNIWGGEFLICKGAAYERVAHLSYTPIIGGDRSMKDAKKTATCFLIHNGLDEYVKDNRSNMIKAALNNNINTVLTSSMGRLFDAIASILDIQDENTYEGECAAKLEKAAALAKKNDVKPAELHYDIIEENPIIKIDPKSILNKICKLKNSIDTASLALGFHYAVADAILNVCNLIRNKENVNTVALSGGVFQNTVLTERVLKILRENGFDVYINMAVPPNDGCISLGQTYVGMNLVNNHQCS